MCKKKPVKDVGAVDDKRLTFLTRLWDNMPTGFPKEQGIMAKLSHAMAKNLIYGRCLLQNSLKTLTVMDSYLR